MSETRRFTDSFGSHWQVVEIEPQAQVTESSRTVERGWLYFFTRGATRVLRDYPTQWRELDWPDLEDLCARGLEVGSERPGRLLRGRAAGFPAAPAPTLSA